MSYSPCSISSRAGLLSAVTVVSLRSRVVAANLRAWAVGLLLAIGSAGAVGAGVALGGTTVGGALRSLRLALSAGLVAGGAVGRATSVSGVVTVAGRDAVAGVSSVSDGLGLVAAGDTVAGGLAVAAGSTVETVRVAAGRGVAVVSVLELGASSVDGLGGNGAAAVTLRSTVAVAGAGSNLLFAVSVVRLVGLRLLGDGGKGEALLLSASDVSGSSDVDSGASGRDGTARTSGSTDAVRSLR